ncbi:hypothetical protein MLD38_012195 [Melastoma candidum]|uniref:Uncharacterized protein n=1 Tax=Melastoma candidum TaxID=119954 RepID=A0ACB9R5L7_9MYRT|nr:hypothetical protein MLD38_012195 [Melastoma candidum]
MGMKRKSGVANGLDEVDRSLYTSFCTVANSLSQLYTQSMNHQRLSFQAGERHSLDKLYQWILRQQEDGARVSTVDIISYLQNELDYGPEDSQVSPRVPFHPQISQITVPTSNPSLPILSSSSVPATTPRQAAGQGDHHQGKNLVFSYSLSSHVRRTLQHYQPQGEIRSTEGNKPQTREANPTSSNDSSMDMHAESPGHDSHY